MCDVYKSYLNLGSADELNISSGSGSSGSGSSGSGSSGSASSGASRTPSPFNYPSHPTTATAVPTLPLSSHIQQVNGFGNSPKAVDKLAINSLESAGIKGQQSEVYSRKVFVGGLPPDIDQGESCCLPI